MRSYGITNAAPYATAPPVGAAGDTYFNTTSKTLYLSDGTVWIQVPGAPSTAAGYWSSRYASAVNVGAAEVTIPVNAPWLANGFSLSGSNVQCNIAGKYMVFASLSCNSSVAGAFFYCRIYQYRGATQIVAIDNFNLAAVSGYPYSEVVTSGIVDLQVGDIINVVSQAAESGHQIDNSHSMLVISPVGGFKGDPGPTGPDIAAAQSSYFFGLNTMGSGIASLAFGQLTWSSIFANNMSLGAGTGLANGAIVFSQTGKYLVNVSLGFSVSGGASVGTVVRFNQYSSVGGLKTQRDTFGNNVPVGQFSAANGSVILDVIAGDYVQAYVQPNGATVTVDGSRSWIEIVPVGGTKGDKGDVGPSGGPVPSGGTVGQIIVKNSAVNQDVSWVQQKCYNGGVINGVSWAAAAGAGVADANIISITPQFTGWFECQFNCVYGFSSGALSVGRILLYCNSFPLPGSSGALISDQLSNAGAVTSPNYANAPPISMAFPVTAGNTYVVTARGQYSPASVTCWFVLYGGWQLYAS